MLKKSLITLVMVQFFIAACSPGGAMPKPTEAMVEKPAEEMMEKPSDSDMAKPTDTMMEKPSEAMAEKPTEEMMGDETADIPLWFSAQLTNVRNGENFTIDSFKGKVVLVETLAMWCPNCKKQQEQVVALHEMLGMNKDLVSVGLDVDKNEKQADLKTYTESNGFDWIYAVAPAEVAREIGNLYGQQFLNVSSTPILVIDRSGKVHPMPFGIKSADDLKRFIDPFLVESM